MRSFLLLLQVGCMVSFLRAQLIGRTAFNFAYVVPLTVLSPLRRRVAVYTCPGRHSNSLSTYYYVSYHMMDLHACVRVRINWRPALWRFFGAFCELHRNPINRRDELHS
jgi:hypothetical protein